MSYQQIIPIRVGLVAVSAATVAALFSGFHAPASSMDTPANGDCEGAIYCITGGTNPWVPNGTNPLVPWGTNGSPGPFGEQQNLPF